MQTLLPSYRAALFLVIPLAWIICLPAFMKIFVFEGGKHGVSPLQTILSFAALSSIVTVLFIGGFTMMFKTTRRSKFIIGSLVCMVGLSGNLLMMRHTVLSGNVLTQHCLGFSEAVGAKMSTLELNQFFSTVIQSSLSEGIYPLSGPSSLHQIVPGVSPMVVTYRDSGQVRQNVIILWKCAGGGYGISYREKAPINRHWLDASFQLDDHIWVVTRSD